MLFFFLLNGDVSINKNLVFKKYKMIKKDNLIEIYGLWCKDIVNVFRLFIL